MNKFLQKRKQFLSIGGALTVSIVLIFLAYTEEGVPDIYADSCTVSCECTSVGVMTCTGAADGAGGCTGSYQFTGIPALGLYVCTEPVTCSPSTQDANILEPITFTATGGGGSGSYWWSAPGGAPQDTRLEGGAEGSNFTTEFGSGGTKTVTVHSGSFSDTCTVNVSGDETVPPSTTLTYALGIGTNVLPSSSSLSSASGVAISGVDALHTGTINSSCGTEDADSHTWCHMNFAVDCTDDGIYDTENSFVYVENGSYGYVQRDVCSYSDDGTYTMRTRAELDVQRDHDLVVNEDGNYYLYSELIDTVVKYGTAQITIGDPAGAEDSLSGSCTPFLQNAEINTSVSFSGSAAGTGSVSCAWSAPGGSPSSGTSCSTFATEYSTTGDKTVTFNVSDSTGSTDDACTVSVSDPTSSERTITVTRSGQGTVTSGVAGISCGATCSGEFEEDSTVTLTATPVSGWEFVEWGGDCAGSTNTCAVTIDGGKNVTAKFRPDVTYKDF